MQCVINLPRYFARQKAFARLLHQQTIYQVLMELNVIAESGSERNLCSLRGMQNTFETIVLKSVNENVKVNVLRHGAKIGDDDDLPSFIHSAFRNCFLFFFS